MKTICVPCQRFFSPKKTGFYFLEGMPTCDGAKPGNSEPEKWEPYKLWAADQWECPGCGTVILSGFGFDPISEHYRPEFAELVKKYGADQFQVNDC